ncbi:MAG TPA: glycosyltransferase family 39 protein, partial [Tepidisphaeraceae bacterium]|nr:glycosyltransferase family 39 protein [Tepidisphaeraceae bacterium]
MDREPMVFMQGVTDHLVSPTPGAMPTEQEVDRPRLIHIIFVAGIVMLAAGLRIYQLSAESLWFDEAATARIVMSPLDEFFTRFRTTENTPPLHYVVLWIWTRVFGSSEFSLRMPSVIAGIASVYLLYQLIRLLGGEWEALMAALLMACSRYQIYFSQEARAYELLVCLSLLSCCAFVQLSREPTRRRQIQFIIATVLMLYAHLFAIFVIAAQNIAYLISLARRPRPTLKWTDWLGVQLASAAMFLPFVPVVFGWMTNRGGSFWIRPLTLHDISAAYVSYAGSELLLCVMLMLAVLGVMKNRSKPMAWSLLISLLLLPVVVPVIASMMLKPLFVARYGIIASPALFALAAWGLGAFRPRALSLSMAAVIAALSLMAPDVGHKEDWRGVATYVGKWARPGDYVMINRRDASRAYDYYNRRADVHVKGFWGPFVTLGVPLPESEHVWLVLY